MLILSAPFQENLSLLPRRLIQFEEDPAIAGAAPGTRPLSRDYSFWLYHRVAQSFRGIALIMTDNFRWGHPGETSLSYGLLRHLLENYADLYNAYMTGGRSYWYWRYMSGLHEAGQREESFSHLEEALPSWASHEGRDGKIRRANRLTRYVQMAPVPSLLEKTLPGLSAFHRSIRSLDSRASSAFHSNSPDFLRDALACDEELFLSAHMALASSLALITAIYQSPWQYNMRELLWPPLLTNLHLLREGNAVLLQS